MVIDCRACRKKAAATYAAIAADFTFYGFPIGIPVKTITIAIITQLQAGVSRRKSV